MIMGGPQVYNQKELWYTHQRRKKSSGHFLVFQGLAMSKNNIYIAEALLKERKRKGKTEYLVKWRGWSAKHNSWEPQENIIGERLFEEFEARNLRRGRRGPGRGRGKRGRPPVVRDESDEEEASVEPSPSRPRRGRPRKCPKIEATPTEEESEHNEKEDSEEERTNVGSMNLEQEEEEEDVEEEEVKEAKEEEEGEEEEEEEEEEAKEEDAKEDEGTEKAAAAQDTSSHSEEPSPVVPGSTSSLEPSVSVPDQEAGPSVAEKKENGVEATSTTENGKAEGTVLKPGEEVFRRPFDKDIPVPRTFHGHMTPMRIESEHHDELQTHGFVLSEPGSSATTEELQVFSEMEQIQAIKKELMNESGWTESGAIRHDTFQYSGPHALTEVVGKDGKPMRFLSL